MTNSGIQGDEGIAALSVRNVSHTYGAKQALANVSFAIAPATFTVLLGLNGAGKTTLFSLISRLYDLREGSIRIFGHDIRRSSSQALRRLGVVFQARTLDLDLSVFQNLSYHASLHGIGAGAARKRIESLVNLVDMNDRLDDKIRSLSGGQMRRIEIARALLHRPPLLMLDEATVGLDIQSRASILNIVRELVETERIGVLWATHLIDEVTDNDHVVVIHKGQAIGKGLVRDVIHQTNTDSIRNAFMRLTGLEGAPVGESV
jgi:ABC-2 type transport system ATP-binding protein